MYNKLFSKILDSSIWLQPSPTRIVWMTMIAVMDEQGFCQFASVANVAHRAIVTQAEAEAAIVCLQSPDPDSSNPDNDGRRIERVPGGWLVLNAAKHREIVTRATQQEQTRERVRRFREKAKRTCNAPVTLSESESESESETEEPRPPTALAVTPQSVTRTRVRSDDGFATFWQVYPRKVGKQAAQQVWTKLRPNAALQTRILAAVQQQRICEQWLKDGGQFIPLPLTWLRQGRWDDEPVQVPTMNESTTRTLSAGARWLAKQKEIAP